VSVDIDQSMAQAVKWGVFVTPAVIVLERGSEALRLVGFRDILAVGQWLPALVEKLSSSAELPADAAAESPARAPTAESAPAALPAEAAPEAPLSTPGAAAGFSLQGAAPAAAPSQYGAAADAAAAAAVVADAVGLVAPPAEGTLSPAPNDGEGAASSSSGSDVGADDGSGVAPCFSRGVEIGATPELYFDHSSVFRQHLGGMPARGSANELIVPGEVFVVGIVDILQQWDFSKRVESSLKALRRPLNAGSISAVDPRTFRVRLIDYISRIVE